MWLLHEVLSTVFLCLLQVRYSYTGNKELQEGPLQPNGGKP